MTKVAIGVAETNASLNMKREKQKKSDKGVIDGFVSWKSRWSDVEETNASLNIKREKKRKAEEAWQASDRWYRFMKVKVINMDFYTSIRERLRIFNHWNCRIGRILQMIP